MATSNFLNFGEPVISSYNLSEGINASLFVENLISITPHTWQNRYRRDVYMQVSEVINTIFYDITRKELLYTTNQFLKKFDGTILFSGMDSKLHKLINFNKKVYFIANSKVYVYDGTTTILATYQPKRILIAPNALTITNGSPVMSIRAELHTLSVGDSIELEGFTDEIGGQKINQTLVVTNVIDVNNIQVAYPVNFTTTLIGGGGNGTITATFPDRNYPDADYICEYKSRLYLGIGKTLYISSMLTPEETDVRFAENTPKEVYSTINTQFLNDSIASLDIEPHWINTENDRDGDIVELFTAPFGVAIFKERGVYTFGGTISDTPRLVFKNDTIPNIRCVDTNGSVVYFVGKNNFYAMSSSSVKTLGSFHKRYIERKINADTRLKYYDGQVFITLGDLELEQLNDDFIEFKKKGICLVYKEATDDIPSNFTFFTDFNSNSFEVVNEILYLHFGNTIQRYGSTIDGDEQFPCSILTHLKYFNRDYHKEKTFTKFYLYGNRMVDVKVKYKVAGNDGFESTIETLPTEHNFLEFVIQTKNKGRGMQFLIEHYNSSKVELHGFQVELG